MRIFTRTRELESRLDRIEHMLSSNAARGELHAVTDTQMQGWLERVESTTANGHAEQMTELGATRDQMNRHFMVYGDRLASVNFKLDSVQSRVERVDRIQDEVLETLYEQQSILKDLAGLPCRQDPAAR